MSRVLARLALWLLPCQVLFCAASPASAQTSLDAVLEPSRARYELPALAAAVVVDGKVVAVGAVGTRKAGAKIPVTVDDRFHVGSDTKAMTALLAAMLVEAGKLRWNSTIAEVFPELAKEMDPALGRVTLEQLVSHTSGIPSDNDAFEGLLQKSLSEDGNLDELRYWLVRKWGKQPLASKPGTKFAYGSMNYVIAGAMIERAGGKTWEELITERVFGPLELRSAGLGPQATLGKIDAPLGHEVIAGKAKAFLAGPNGDNPLVLGPSGTAHMSVLDFARWAGWNAGQGKRGPKLVKPETLKKLHTPVIAIPEKKDAAPGTPARGKYALGWGEVSVDWAPEPLLYHGGSNMKNLAHIWLDPKRDFAMVLVTNVAGRKADEALMALAP
ncbi:MAG TPA: serine hydrolase domain-containing protein, partial [Gemmataceae bacterium]|nr:serine hydrolase domain-containing protein [Gemmataceae bacterium]